MRKLDLIWQFLIHYTVFAAVFWGLSLIFGEMAHPTHIMLAAYIWLWCETKDRERRS